MVEIVKEGDFIEIDYTGKIVDTGEIFDSTYESEVKKINKNAKFGPIIIVLGKKHLIKGLDLELDGKEVGNSYSFDVSPELGFGKKDPKLITLVNTKKFLENKINPVVGLTINIDGIMGTVKSVTGGRTLVDFNHPLASKNLSYNVKILRKVNDTNEKIKTVCKNIGFEVECSFNEDIAKIKFVTPTNTIQDIKEALVKSLKESISEVKEVKFD